MQCEAKPRLSSENETTIIKPLISAAIGTIFGFALNRGMVYHPVVIREQFIGQNFTMIKMFLSAVSSSLLVNSIMSLVPSLKTNFDKSREKYYKGKLNNFQSESLSLQKITRLLFKVCCHQAKYLWVLYYSASVWPSPELALEL